MTGRILIAIAAALALAAGSHAAAQDTAAAAPAGYDPALAKELGADDYGMASYVLVILKTGPAKIDDAARRTELFRGHFANMKRLGEEGTLVLAGPFDDPAGDWRGMFVFDVATVEAARALVETDPTVAAGVFVADYKKYYGSAALRAVNETHARIQKTAIE
jgi:uncharacterized protein YciI